VKIAHARRYLWVFHLLGKGANQKNMPTLPANFVADISNNATDMIASLSGFATLIIGVLLAGVVLTLIIHAIKK